MGQMDDDVTERDFAANQPSILYSTARLIIGKTCIVRYSAGALP